MIVGYLVNQYPHVSHTFIRREILALEAHGLTVARYSIRRPAVKLVDPEDIAEQAKTRILLEAGAFAFLASCVALAVTRPLAWCRAFALAIRLGGRSGKRLRTMIYFAEACLLVRWLRQTGVQHLHAHFGTNPADVCTIARVLGGPHFSFTVHGPEEFDKPEAHSLRLKIEQSSFVVAISSFGRSQLYRWARLEDWHKVRLIRCGVDPAYLESQPPPPPDTNRILSIGRLAEQKGQLVLLQAAALLRTRGIDFQLVLAGDGPMRPQLEAYLREHDLAGHVQITGWVSNDRVREELMAARFLVLPSFAEGLPVVLMEALALERPVLTTYIAGIPELVRDGVNGWLIPAGDAESLAAAMERGLSTPVDKLRAMGAAGAAAVRTMHDVRHEARKLAEFFFQTTGEQRAHLPTADRQEIEQ